MMFHDTLGVLLLTILITTGLSVSGAFSTNQTSTEEPAEGEEPWYLNPFIVVTIVGFLSLIISLIVLSAGTNLRNRKIGEDSTVPDQMNSILTNLESVKSKLGEPAFTNLINGLSSAAKEEIVFPEPVGVLRHKEFRRALTISVALTFFTLLGVSAMDPKATTEFNNNPLMQAFAWVFVAIIAFYFGDRILENYAKFRGVQLPAKTTEPISIEEATAKGGNIQVKVKNNRKSKITVRKISVNGEKVEDFKEFDIEGEKSVSKKLKIPDKVKEAKEYKVIVEAGPVTAEKEISVEEEKNETPQKAESGQKEPTKKQNE